MNDSEETRELTVGELDIEAAVDAMAFQLGTAWGALEGAALFGGEPSYDRVAWLCMISFAKALGALALENPGRARELWARFLVEPMPFGLLPPGMPRVPR
jgi:hypothetical protein